MMKYLLIVLTGFCTSFFIYPFNPAILPAANTKMILAAMGLVVMGYSLSTQRKGEFVQSIFTLSLCALAVSFAGLVAMIINETPDTAYASYIISMWVWLSAAYFVTKMIHAVHGRLGVELVCYYLIAVSTTQSILAIVIDNVPVVKSIVDSMMVSEGFMGVNESRLYGLGCALDVAGSRFSAALVMIAFLIPREMEKNNNKLAVILLFFCFGTITVLGNMMSRTTIWGVVVAALYLLYASCNTKGFSEETRMRVLQYSFSFLLLFGFASVFSYHTNAQMRKNIRFGFEGFFSLVEKGHWETHSNNMLQNMVKWPDNTKTWIIGDGYFDNPDKKDPYYVGPQNWTAFYKGTDIGYCRFIFYFGIIGLFAFSVFMLKAAHICGQRIPDFRYLFLWIFALNMIIWSKVASDLFMVLAPFLCVSQADQTYYDKIEQKQHNEQQHNNQQT